MCYVVKYVADCFRGSVRSRNEDNLWCNGKYLPRVHTDLSELIEGKVNEKEKPSFAVFDGVGGAADGEVASFLAAKTFDEIDRGKNDIESICDAMNDAVCKRASEDRVKMMGSTVAALTIQDGKAVGFNIGDSRVYKFDGKNLVQISMDDRLKSPYARRSAITQCLGIPKEELQIEAHIFEEDLSDGMMFLICSDGLTGMIRDRKIREILKERTPIEEKLARMKEIVLRKGAEDNTTMILLKVAEKRKFRISR